MWFLAQGAIAAAPTAVAGEPAVEAGEEEEEEEQRGNLGISCHFGEWRWGTHCSCAPNGRDATPALSPRANVEL